MTQQLQGTTPARRSAGDARRRLEHGYVIAVCSRNRRSTSMAKPAVRRLQLDVERGVVGDIHAGPGDRQVALLAAETLEELHTQVGHVDHGAMGENLIIGGIEASHLGAGTRLVFSTGAILQVTQARTPCAELESVAPGLLRAAVGRCGLFARVLRDGEVSAGDRVWALSPIGGLLL